MDGNTAPQNPQPDPRKLVFITPGVSPEQQPGREQEEDGLLRDVAPHATVLHTPGHVAEKTILSAIKGQVEKYGTLKEIVIDSHGSPNRLYATYDNKLAPDTVIDTSHFLNEIQNMQKELGTKITDRIVFTGCDVMTDLSPEWVDYYRNQAKNLGTEIVGNTSL